MGKVYVGRRERMTVDDWLALGWKQEEAEQLAETDQTTTRVVVVSEDGVAPLRHHVCHSPTGFEWGYAGSGPAELARCILIDYLDAHADFEAHPTGALLPVSYQSFKFDMIARLPQDENWSIRSEEIAEWLASARA